MFKKFTHNVLGWAKPVKGTGDYAAFNQTYDCECGVKCCQDSQGNWLHLEEPNKI